jgi:hypothetical protein
MDNVWERFYAPRFSLILSGKLPEICYLPILVLDAKDFIPKFEETLPAGIQDKLSKIKGKAKGFGVPVSSTVLHFLYPTEFPIIDVKTREVLYLTANTKFIPADDLEGYLDGYKDFRSEMLKIKKETGYNLRKIDIALTNFHKKLQDSIEDKYKEYYGNLNPDLKDIGKGPTIAADPNYRRLLIDMIKMKV